MIGISGTVALSQAAWKIVHLSVAETCGQYQVEIFGISANLDLAERILSNAEAVEKVRHCSPVPADLWLSG